MKKVSSRLTRAIQAVLLLQQGLIPIGIYLVVKSQLVAAAICALLGVVAVILFWRCLVRFKPVRVDEAGLVYIGNDNVGLPLVSYRRLPLLRFPPVEIEMASADGGKRLELFLPSISANWLRVEPEIDVILRRAIAVATVLSTK